MQLANYLICTHPRSGSNYLCELLASTGKLGNPAEYFHEANMQNVGLSSRNPADLEARFQFVMDRTATDNGVVGVKVFIFDLPQLNAAGILDRFRDYTFIFLQRQDKLSQGISIRKALKTGKLTSEHPSASVVVDYDYDDIKLRIARTIKAERDWQSVFHHYGVAPVHCLYEDLAASPQAIVDRIAGAVGLPSGAPIGQDKLRLKVQRDATSLAWQDRFLAESAKKDPGLHEFCAARLAISA